MKFGLFGLIFNLFSTVRLFGLVFNLFASVRLFVIFMLLVLSLVILSLIWMFLKYVSVTIMFRYCSCFLPDIHLDRHAVLGILVRDILVGDPVDGVPKQKHRRMFGGCSCTSKRTVGCNRTNLFMMVFLLFVLFVALLFILLLIIIDLFLSWFLIINLFVCLIYLIISLILG